MTFIFLHDMQNKWHWNLVRSPLRGSLTDPLAGIQASYILSFVYRWEGERRRGSSATSIVALLAWSASHCSFRLTHSGRFLLRRIAHWATASFVPLFHTEHRALQTSCRAELLIFPLIFFYIPIYVQRFHTKHKALQTSCRAKLHFCILIHVYTHSSEEVGSVML